MSQNKFLVVESMGTDTEEEMCFLYIHQMIKHLVLYSSSDEKVTWMYSLCYKYQKTQDY